MKGSLAMVLPELREIAPKVEKQTSSFDPDKRIEKRIDSLAGVEKGREMTFDEADSGHVNPHFPREGYDDNCQTCVVVFEARLRGYDIEACPFCEGSNTELLSRETNLAWRNFWGRHPSYIENRTPKTPEELYNFVSGNIKPGQRFTLEGAWKNYGCGHIISVMRGEDGNLLFYDPQTNKKYTKESAINGILKRMDPCSIKLLRVDSLDIDCDFVNPIVRRSGSNG